LERLAESRASELSGGELQRMTVARALAQAHPVVLADEPTGQLDHTSSLVVARALRQLAEAGRAVVVATHDAAVADACDVVWTIEDGRLSAGR
jgi:putative ABC transport system ATP-binding protein